MAWSLDLSWYHGLLFCCFLSVMLNIVLLFRRYATGQAVKTTPLVMTVAFLHFVTTVFTMGYPFIFNRRYDLPYIIIYTLIILHWVVFSECILSYFEKVLIDPTYVLSSDKNAHPFIDDLLPSDVHRTIYHTIHRMYGIVVLCFVLMRYGTSTFDKKYHVIFLMISLFLMSSVFYYSMELLKT